MWAPGFAYTEAGISRLAVTYATMGNTLRAL